MFERDTRFARVKSEGVNTNEEVFHCYAEHGTGRFYAADRLRRLKTADSSSDAQDSTTSTSADGGTLRMGTNATFRRTSSLATTATLQGIDADIAAAIADKLGMKLEITDMEFDSLIPALQSDTIDVALAGMTVTPDRQENVDFSDSYAKGVQVIIVKDGSDIASRMIWRARTSAFRPAPPATSTAPATTVRSM